MLALLMTGAIGWGLFFSIGIFSTRGSEAFGFFVLAWAPMAALCAFLIWRAGKRAELHSRRLADLGVQAGQGLDHSEGGDGIVIDPKSKRLVLYNGKRWKAYPYEDVRGWEDVHETAGQIMAAGLGAANNLAAGASNIGAAHRAAKATGFFVTVRDAQMPRWRITMARQHDRSRWMEIFQQELNEGGLRP